MTEIGDRADILILPGQPLDLHHQIHPCGLHDHCGEGPKADGRFLLRKFSQDARKGIQHTQPVPGVWGTCGVAQAEPDDLLGAMDTVHESVPGLDRDVLDGIDQRALGLGGIP